MHPQKRATNIKVFESLINQENWYRTFLHFFHFTANKSRNVQNGRDGIATYTAVGNTDSCELLKRQGEG